MRFFLYYDASGQIVTLHAGSGGFHDECDPLDPNVASELDLIRAQHETVSRNLDQVHAHIKRASDRATVLDHHVKIEPDAKKKTALAAEGVALCDELEALHGSRKSLLKAHEELTPKKHARELALHLQESVKATHPDLAGGLEVDCGCEVAPHTRCDCPWTYLATKYFSGGKLRDKPQLRFVLNDELVTDRSFMATPGSKVRVQVQAQVSDGAKLTLRRKGGAVLFREKSRELIFAGGKVDFALVAPAQGLSGTVSFSGGLIMGATLEVVGFAS